MTPMKTRIKKDLAYRRVAGELFIVDSSKARLHELNGPAAVIWEGLAAGKSGPAIVSALVSEYETDAETARMDLEVFMNELRAAGLIDTLKI